MTTHDETHEQTHESRRLRRLGVVAAVVAGVAWLATPGPPAGAAVVVTSSGTQVFATVTGVTGTVGVSCVSGRVRVLDTPATPSLDCDDVTAATLTGDANRQVFGAPSPIASFPRLAQITIDAGGGDDEIEGTTRRDVIVGGAGNDVFRGPAVGGVDQVGLGGQPGDVVIVDGTSGDDTITARTGAPTTRTNVVRGTWNLALTTTSRLVLRAGAGDDLVDVSDVVATTTIGLTELDGQAGDDRLLAGAVTSILSGGLGANTLTGGPQNDIVLSTSPTDTVRGNGGGDAIFDFGDGRVGRVVDTTGTGATPDQYLVSLPGDAFVRTRPLAANGARLTTALARTGRQDVDSGVGTLLLDIAKQPSLPNDRVMVDTVALLGQAQVIPGDSGTYVDLVVPSGRWSTRSGGLITFSGGYKSVDVDASRVLIRAPFTDADERFAHRVIRDLLMRFPTSSERNNLRNRLDQGTVTRTQAILDITDGDPYRAVQVDRAFVDILRRTTDSAGRAYWVDRLDDGLVLRRLRANLYGSPEYYARAGNTTPQYVRSSYRDILGREADASEVAYWVDQIDDVRLPRGTIADRFLNTPEARLVVIRDLFLRWSNREPTANETRTWSPELASTSTDGELALVRFLAASDGYYNRPDV